MILAQRPGPIDQFLGRQIVEDVGIGAAGIGAEDDVGMPVTLHFHRELSADERQEIQCRVRSAGERPGVLVSLHETGGIMAPGCFAYVPREPLPAGDVFVDWNLPHGMIAKDHMFPRLEFTVE